MEPNDPDMSFMRRTLAKQATEFMALVESGEVTLNENRWPSGMPSVLNPLRGRRHDRDTYLAEVGPLPGLVSLYDPHPETATFSAVRALAWVATHAPNHPIRVSPSQTGMLYATFALPQDVTVTLLLLTDELQGGATRVVTAESLVEALHHSTQSDGGSGLPEGLRLDESHLVDSPYPAPEPIPPSSHVPSHRKLIVPTEALEFGHYLIPATSPADDNPPAPFMGWTLTGDPYQVHLRPSTLAAIAWLDPFAIDEETDPEEAIFLLPTSKVAYWYGNKAGLSTPLITTNSLQ